MNRKEIEQKLKDLQLQADMNTMAIRILAEMLLAHLKGNPCDTTKLYGVLLDLKGKEVSP